MTARERDICARFKRFRESSLLSQSAFAAELGLTHNQLAGIEYGHTPLRYSQVARANNRWCLNPIWLATGNGRPHFPRSIPSDVTSQFGKDAIFSVVYDAFHKHWEREQAQRAAAMSKAAGKLDFNPDAAGRLAALEMLSEELEEWFATVSDSEFNSFFGELLQHGKSSAALRSKNESAVRINARREALTEAKLLLEHRRKNLALQNSTLDTIHASVNSGDVKAQWPILKIRLQKATAPTGLKSKLAEFLGVKLASVSQWLSDSDSQREPGAETTLRMLKWVELQEQQAK